MESMYCRILECLSLVKVFFNIFSNSRTDAVLSRASIKIRVRKYVINNLVCGKLTNKYLIHPKKSRREKESKTGEIIEIN